MDFVAGTAGQEVRMRTGPGEKRRRRLGRRHRRAVLVGAVAVALPRRRHPIARHPRHGAAVAEEEG